MHLKNRQFRKLVGLALFTFLLGLMILPLATLSAIQNINQLSLSLSVIPPKLPADGRQYPALVISLLNSSNMPSVALHDITVYLSSSELNVADVPDKAVIQTGHIYTVVNITTTLTPGTTTITAHSTGLGSGTVSISTTTPSGFPSKLKVFVSPAKFISRPVDYGTIIVELLDDNNLPAKTAVPVVVSLFSSNTFVASLDQKQVVVQPGHFFTTGTFKTSFIPGTAQVTASSTGYSSGQATVSVIGPSPLGLKVYAEPPILGLNTTGKIAISLVDQNGAPARAPFPINVKLVSSNVTVVRVQDNVSIAPGTIYAVGSVNATGIGSAIITASSPGLESSSVPIRVDVGGKATQLKNSYWTKS